MVGDAVSKTTQPVRDESLHARDGRRSGQARYRHVAKEISRPVRSHTEVGVSSASFTNCATRSESASLMLVHDSDTSTYGRVYTDADERVTAFREKTGKTVPGWINAGVYMVSRERIDSIPSGRAVSLEKEVFPAWISHGLHGFQSDGELIDIGTPERYQRAPEFFRALAGEVGNGVGTSSKRERHASLRTDVLAPGARRIVRIVSTAPVSAFEPRPELPGSPSALRSWRASTS